MIVKFVNKIEHLYTANIVDFHIHIYTISWLLIFWAVNTWSLAEMMVTYHTLKYGALLIQKYIKYQLYQIDF